MKRIEAAPTPSVLVWARVKAGLSVDSAAKKAGVKTEQLEMSPSRSREQYVPVMPPQMRRDD
jgi:hypothetical protein